MPKNDQLPPTAVSAGPPCSPSFDRSRYPTDETCEAVATWNPCDPVGWFEFVEAAWSDYGRVRRDGWTIDFVTGGWSGNEQLIGAMHANVAWSLCWESSHRGGLHRFEIPENFRK